MNATNQSAGTVKSQVLGETMSRGSAAKKETSLIRVEDEKEDAPQPTKVSDKRKADTDCLNREFEMTLTNRREMAPKDFNMSNREFLQSISQGKPP